MFGGGTAGIDNMDPTDPVGRANFMATAITYGGELNVASLPAKDVMARLDAVAASAQALPARARAADLYALHCEATRLWRHLVSLPEDQQPINVCRSALSLASIYGNRPGFESDIAQARDYVGRYHKELNNGQATGTPVAASNDLVSEFCRLCVISQDPQDIAFMCETLHGDAHAQGKASKNYSALEAAKSICYEVGVLAGRPELLEGVVAWMFDVGPLTDSTDQERFLRGIKMAVATRNVGEFATGFSAVVTNSVRPEIEAESAVQGQLF